MTGAVLTVSDVTVDFGGNRAVDGASFEAGADRITGLIGPNGAGKTTLFNVITGLQRPTHGRVLLDGHDISRLKTHRRARRGMARTFQRLELFTLLTVWENVEVAARSRGSDVGRLLERVGLGGRGKERVDGLPTGQARLVELARALATEPRLLLLDEPASGQTEHESVRFGALLRELASEGLTIVLVEHDVSLVMNVCDHICVLDAGQVIASGEPEQIRTDPAVIDAYLGAPT